MIHDSQLSARTIYVDRIFRQHFPLTPSNLLIRSCTNIINNNKNKKNFKKRNLLKKTYIDIRAENFFGTKSYDCICHCTASRNPIRFLWNLFRFPAQCFSNWKPTLNEALFIACMEKCRTSQIKSSEFLREIVSSRLLLKISTDLIWTWLLLKRFLNCLLDIF